MKKLFRHIALGLILVGIMASSCVKDEYSLQNMKTPEWDPNFAAPLINSRLTFWDILNDFDTTDIVIEDETQFLYLVYNSTAFSQTAEDLISIPDQNASASHNFSTGTIAVADSFVTTLVYTYNFNFPSSQVIDSIYLKSGSLNLSINSNFNLPAKIELKLPGTKQGQPFKETVYMNTPTGNQSIGLNNTKLIFNHSGGNNKLEMTFRVVLYGNGNPNQSPYNINISNSFYNVKFKAIYGYLGQLNFAMNEDTVKVKLYDNHFNGIINWQDPRYYLTATNYLGVPVQLTIDLLETKSTRPPFNTYQIVGAGIPNPWNILYPSFSQMGQGVKTLMYLDKNNSNIDAAYDIAPQQMNALISAVTNSSGPTQNFVFDTSRFTLDAKVELPLHGTAHNFTIVDTMDVNIGEDFKNSEYIDWILFKIYAENGFPIDAEIQIYFLDSGYNIVDSLLAPPQQLIHAATPGPAPDYIVTGKYKKMITTTIYNDRIAEYHRIKYAVVKAKMHTFNSGTQIVKIYSYYDLHVKIGAQVQMNFN